MDVSATESEAREAAHGCGGGGGWDRERVVPAGTDVTAGGGTTTGDDAGGGSGARAAEREVDCVTTASRGWVAVDWIFCEAQRSGPAPPSLNLHGSPTGGFWGGVPILHHGSGRNCEMASPAERFWYGRQRFAVGPTVFCDTQATARRWRLPHGRKRSQRPTRGALTARVRGTGSAATCRRRLHTSHSDDACGIGVAPPFLSERRAHESPVAGALIVNPLTHGPLPSAWPIQNGSWRPPPAPPFPKNRGRRGPPNFFDVAVRSRDKRQLIQLNINKSGLHALEWKTRDPYSLVDDSLVTRTHCTTKQWRRGKNHEPNTRRNCEAEGAKRHNQQRPRVAVPIRATDSFWRPRRNHNRLVPPPFVHTEACGNGGGDQQALAIAPGKVPAEPARPRRRGDQWFGGIDSRHTRAAVDAVTTAVGRQTPARAMTGWKLPTGDVKIRAAVGGRGGSDATAATAAAVAHDASPPSAAVAASVRTGGTGAASAAAPPPPAASPPSASGGGRRRRRTPRRGRRPPPMPPSADVHPNGRRPPRTGGHAAAANAGGVRRLHAGDEAACRRLVRHKFWHATGRVTRGRAPPTPERVSQTCRVIPFPSVDFDHVSWLNGIMVEAQSTRRVYGVLRHVLANGSASFQSHPNHANTFRPNPADRAIPHTKDLRAETGSFGAFKPNTFTCARFFLISRARERVWKGMCQLRLLAFAGMIGREGSSRLNHSDQEMGDPSVLERRLLGAAA
ncbi:hypothetical protein BU14_0096s0017 [Porphyra umbilicalis]|uniref:Uncharacterized protein n=1 Tax=Porphyra umbilicalis TaxID=2786 RepID=A0A1X6PDF6_PORUM|nr:hypothetical protein BU14_0096s0017 [Porphyra umbilicalis]|eukprot:OSX78864.1 hypothetical protein BU14_0096s0017 [Porphyra umbilicalis]